MGSTRSGRANRSCARGASSSLIRESRGESRGGTPRRDLAWVREEPGAVVLDLLIQPRASRTRSVGEHDGRLKIQLAAPPVDGEANVALIEFLAAALRVRKAEVTIVRGETGRRKMVRVTGVSAQQVIDAFAPGR